MMKRVAFIFIFIFLCLLLLLYKGKAYTQQGTTQVDLSHFFDQYFLFPFPTYPALPPSYPSFQWPPLQPQTMFFPAIPTMTNYSYLFGNNGNPWQIYNPNPSIDFFSSSKKPSKKGRTGLSDGDLTRFSNCKELKKELKKFWEAIKPSIPSSGDDTLDPPNPPVKVTPPYYYGIGGYGGYGGYGLGGYGGYGGYGLGGYGVYGGVGGYGLSSYSAGLYGGYGGYGGYGLSSYSAGLYGGYGGYGGYGLGGYGASLYSGYGGYGGYGLSGYGAGLYSGYGGIGGSVSSFRFKTTSDGLDGNKGNSDYGHSITNIQVAGVDEADIIKNDSTYIYMIKGKTVQIIQGFPADAMQIVKVISLENYTDFELKRLYVKGNTLVLIGDQPVPASTYFSTPTPGTRIFIYDITDRAHEILARKFIFWGTYVQSRRAGDTLYVIMNEPAPLKRFEGTITDLRVLLPRFYDSYLYGNNEDADGIICDCDEIAYLPKDLSPNYLVVIGIPLDDHTKVIGREVILGKSSQIYATSKNLYVTSEYKNDNPTRIYKFWLDDETIAYGSNAEVPGKIIDQFSMDEYEDHLRIAATSGSGSQAQNDIYIFDSSMKMTESLENFTSGGDIQSIRFEGDRCYTVISGDMLPLSVISLTDPTNPNSLKVLDILSGTYYLHPIDENRLLGFGREIVGNSEMGIKISLYDLTDVNDPQLISEDEIGSHYTQSDVLTDYRALLLSLENNLMAFPVTVTGENGALPYIFQGTYVYYIDDNGFEKIEDGITHYLEGTFPKSSYDDSSPYHISRIIYMGDNYYAVSKKRITARDILTHTETFSLSLE